MTQDALPGAHQQLAPAPLRMSAGRLAVGGLLLASVVWAQPNVPVAGSPAVLTAILVSFPTQDQASRRPAQDYLDMMGLPGRVTLHGGQGWTIYDAIRPIILDDAHRLWQSGELHSLWVEAVDEPFENGVVGRRVVFYLIERTRASASPRGLPAPPLGFETPPAHHERIYPPPRPLNANQR